MQMYPDGAILHTLAPMQNGNDSDLHTGICKGRRIEILNGKHFPYDPILAGTSATIRIVHVVGQRFCHPHMK